MSRRQAYFAHGAWLPAGWCRDVRIEVENGRIVAVAEAASPDGAERLAGPVIPGMGNLHSHAFQRAMAGLTERADGRGDNFWSWREVMYRFLARLAPDDCEAIAAQLYVEMLKSGYTGVAEFHYLHRDPAGKRYADAAEMAWRIGAAAETAGIALTLLPVFYAHATFGGTPPSEGQRRFIHSLDEFADLLDALFGRLRAAGAGAAGGGVLRRVGIAPHSLRAVTPEELSALVAMGEAHDADAPIHIHAAEQRKEVEDSLAWSGQRPVAWLLDHQHIDARWCLVHATQLDGEETRRLAACGAVAGLCPTTEANLGDGIFNAADFLAQGGRWGIGGDSHVGVDPFRELALIEYAQRLTAARRNILAAPGCESIGAGLYRQALAGGAQALGQDTGAIAIGMRADLVVLDTDDPALAEREGHALLDAAVFGPVRQAVRDTMVNGVWLVREGRHAREADIFARYRHSLRRLLHAD